MQGNLLAALINWLFYKLFGLGNGVEFVWGSREEKTEQPRDRKGRFAKEKQEVVFSGSVQRKTRFTRHCPVYEGGKFVGFAQW